MGRWWRRPIDCYDSQRILVHGIVINLWMGSCALSPLIMTSVLRVPERCKHMFMVMMTGDYDHRESSLCDSRGVFWLTSIIHCHYGISNWSHSQIPWCTCSIPHNAPFRAEMCTFLFWMEHCGIWNRCILGFVKMVYYKWECSWRRTYFNMVPLRVELCRYPGTKEALSWDYYLE